jgi:hypothetical protein
MGGGDRSREMSTALEPPSYYRVTPEGESAREFRTVAEMAAPVARLSRRPVTVSVVTGYRRRSLTQPELLELHGG